MDMFFAFLKTILIFVSVPLVFVGLFFYVSIPICLILTYVLVKGLLIKKTQSYAIDQITIVKKSMKICLFGFLIAIPVFIIAGYYLGDNIFDLMCNSNCSSGGGFGDITTIGAIMGMGIIGSTITAVVISFRLINDEVQEFSKIDNISQIQ